MLRQAGAALYGERWQTPLSRDLQVTDRTMRNWASGRHEMPTDVPAKLLAVLRERGDSVAKLTVAIEEHLKAAGRGPASEEREAGGAA